MTARTLLLLLLTLWCALVIGGCAADIEGDTDGDRPLRGAYPPKVWRGDIDGVDCIWAKSGYGGGLSCDWTNAQAPR